MKETDDKVQWLLDGDAAIRWQTLRDLLGSAKSVVERERKKIAVSGWGGALLARQESNGGWASGLSTDDGLYTPKWISTTYTMLLLRDFGLPAENRQARKACALLLDRGLRSDGGIAYVRRPNAPDRGETCITGMVLSILAYFGCRDARLDKIVAHLLDEQMPDGGWNCRRRRGATHSSVNTTISVLEALWLYELHRGPTKKVQQAQMQGREFLLVHRLFRSHRTGRIIKTNFIRFAFPPRWHYDILRALDYFRAVNAPRDKRLSEAIDIVHRTQTSDGRWTLQQSYKGKTYFELERTGAPSRWNTLRALRVLKWWDGAEGS